MRIIIQDYKIEKLKIETIQMHYSGENKGANVLNCHESIVPMQKKIFLIVMKQASFHLLCKI